ncbi:MAG: SRPBCC domain-containing protein, partial [Gemmatimonadaceae bacterium]
MSQSSTTAPNDKGNTLSVTTPAEREIRTERIVNAARERVWRAMTDPAHVKQWWGRGNPLDIERDEVQRGGHWRYVEHSDHGAHGFEGRYREVVPNERIVRTFEWDGMPGYPILTTTILEDAGAGKTRIISLS